MALEVYDVLQCVDRGLDAFGSNMKQTTYWTLLMKEGVSSDKILSQPDAFIRALKEVFGSGFPLAQRSIVKELKKVFDLPLPTSSYSIAEALEVASKTVTEIVTA